ncbi:hypothetical protein B0H14DRAFT_3749386 [Mycena olivaceomarginata]|nr:hypothetical protein B0H14DRAFT_3749386 [Mycena olivaceomarginata]
MPTRPGSNSDSLFNDASPRTPNYSRVSSFRSPELEVLLYSPHVRIEPTSWASRSIPIYGDHDVIGGKIILGSNCVSGRVVLNASGAFISDGGGTGKQRHIFFSASKVIHVASVSDASRKGIRQMFAGRSRQSRSTSIAVDSATRTFPFMFDFRCNRRAGEILPTTLYPSDSKSLAVEVSYQITATWEPLKLTETPSSLMIPIIVQPDPDFHSLELGGQGSWIEIPLSSHRPVPIRCAPGFPSWKTVHTLLLELTTVLSDRSSDSRSSRLTAKRLFKRSRSKTSLSSSQSSDSTRSTASQSLPSLPSRTIFSDIQTVYTGMSIGFPKRPRHTSSSSKAHPTLEEARCLPDGLYKDTIPLGRDILTSFNWGGISVKYYFEVSVLLGQDELRAKDPINPVEHSSLNVLNRRNSNAVPNMCN